MARTVIVKALAIVGALTVAALLGGAVVAGAFVWRLRT